MVEEARQTDLSVSELCWRYGLAPGQFSSWENQSRQGALEALRDGSQGRKKSDTTIPLQAEIERLRAVIAELSARNLALKVEALVARGSALDDPPMGCKRLAWQVVDPDVACLRPYQAYDLLRAGDLLSPRSIPHLEPLKRPPSPDHADEDWHIDLMHLYIKPRWYYPVDILDGYSRSLVLWSLNLTMLTDTVTLTAQDALDVLTQRRSGEPKLVHDRGPQFLSREWREVVKAVGVTAIKTHVAHPQSNGLVERVHRTHQEEDLNDEALSDYYRALEAVTSWSGDYNHEWPHTALKYL